MTTTSFPVIQIEKTGKRLRNMRKENGIRVAAVCEYMGGISEQAVYKWERGACLPTIDNLLALSHLYHVQMEDLLVYEEAEMASSCFLRMYRVIQSPVMHAQPRNGDCLKRGACDPSA